MLMSDIGSLSVEQEFPVVICAFAKYLMQSIIQHWTVTAEFVLGR